MEGRVKTPRANDRHLYRGEHPWFDNAEFCAWCGAKCQDSFCSDECEAEYRMEYERCDDADRKYHEHIDEKMERLADEKKHGDR